MKLKLLTVCLGVLVLTCRLGAAPAPLSEAAALRDRGDFKGSERVLKEALLVPGLSGAARKDMQFQLEVLGRLKREFHFTKEELFTSLSKSVKDLSPAEFNRWVAKGYFDSRIIDGQTWYLNLDAENIFFQHPEMSDRQLDKKEDWQQQHARYAVSQSIRKAVHEQHTPYVLPHQFHCIMTVSVENGATTPGDVIRAWLPIPRTYPFQNNFKLISSSAPVKSLAPETSAIRSVYLEQSSSEEGSAEFTITYNYTMSGIYFELDPGKIQPADLSDPVLKKYTSESPHVVFSPRIRELSAKIAGHETNPMLEARAFYDWIGDNIKYSYTREYSTVPNLSDDCLTCKQGDCGEEAMLFIALCRTRGIPARWQSGWTTFPHAVGNHDWSEIYLAPYGWVPVDACRGMAAHRYYTTLTDSERRELRDFYFGGLDYYRMAANSDHSQELDPPKETPRSDDIDFQRGELESDGHNIYFDKYKCSLRVQDVK